MSSHHGMAANTKKGRTPTNTRPYSQVREQHSTMRKPGIPPARIPEITWRMQKRYNDLPLVTSKQTTTTPRRNESGEKKSETDSETRAIVRKS